MKLICANTQCGKEFDPSVGAIKYCSPQCRRMATKEVYCGGSVRVSFEGVRVYQRRFGNRTDLRGMLKEWETIYPGSIVTVLFDEPKTKA